MFRYLLVLTVFTGAINGRSRFSAKEIERNFTGIYNEIREIEKSLQSYHQRMERLSYESRNDTVAYNQLLKRLTNLHYELDRVKKIQKQELDEKIRWKILAENNSRLIYNFKVHLQNQINKNQNSLFKRLEILERRYNLQQQSVLHLENKLDLEVVKNARLSDQVVDLKDSIRKVYNNMTLAITKLRRKHDWLASRIHNKSVADTEMMRYYRRFAEELQKQIYALDQKIAIEQKETPVRLKELLMTLLAEITEKAKTTSGTTIPTTTTTTGQPATTTTTTTTTTTASGTTTKQPSSTPKITRKPTTPATTKTEIPTKTTSTTTEKPTTTTTQTTSAPTTPTTSTQTTSTQTTSTPTTSTPTTSTPTTSTPTTTTTTTTTSTPTTITPTTTPTTTEETTTTTTTANDSTTAIDFKLYQQSTEKIEKKGHLEKEMESFLQAIFGPSIPEIERNLQKEGPKHIEQAAEERFFYENQQ